jgi:hypothetical protein
MIRFDEVPNRRYVAGQLTWFCMWVAVTAIGLYLAPKPEGHGTHTELGLPPCPCVAIFGRPCPGCGLTTSFTATLHGQFGLAFKAHPLGPILYALFTCTALLCFYGWWKRKRVDFTAPPMRYLSGAFVVIFLIFGVARFVMFPHYGDHDPYHIAVLASSVGNK